jgi:DNA-directed RNA polymerase specialized sigma24 family protein
MKYSEIAKLLGISVDAVKKAERTGLRKLARLFPDLRQLVKD